MKTFATYAVTKKIYNDKQGFIRGVIVFWDDCRLEFSEVKDVEVTQKIKYRYHYMDKDDSLIFRYDNAPHHEEIQTFPHHKHLKTEVIDSSEKSLYDVLIEIKKMASSE